MERSARSWLCNHFRSTPFPPRGQVLSKVRLVYLVDNWHLLGKLGGGRTRNDIVGNLFGCNVLGDGLLVFLSLPDPFCCALSLTFPNIERAHIALFTHQFERVDRRGHLTNLARRDEIKRDAREFGGAWRCHKEDSGLYFCLLRSRDGRAFKEWFDLLLVPQ